MSNAFPPQFYPAATVPTGIAGPRNVLYVPLNQSIVPSYVTPLDFTTVTGVQLRVVRSDGSAVNWNTATFLQVTSAGLIAVYTFANDGSDCPTGVDGAYRIRPWLQITPDVTYTIPCSTSTLQVTAT